MDPVQKMWMYENWVADQAEQAELAKNHAYLLASFTNPEAVKQLMGGGNVHESSDEEFDESSKMVRELNMKALVQPSNNQENQGRRRRRTIKG